MRVFVARNRIAPGIVCTKIYPDKSEKWELFEFGITINHEINLSLATAVGKSSKVIKSH